MAVTSTSERVALPIPASNDANAHRSGIIPRRSVSSSALSATLPGAVEVTGAAQRRGQDHLGFQGVPSRAERRGCRSGRVGVVHRRRALTAGHREFSGHPGDSHVQPRRPPLVYQIGGAVQCPLRCREPSRAERIRGQSDQRIATRLAIGTRKCRRPAVPGTGAVVPAELATGTTHGCCGPATPQGHAARDALRRDRPARCCSGPVRRPQRPAATVHTGSSRRAAASTQGRRRTRRSIVLRWK